MSLILDGTNGETFPSWTTATRPASPAVGQMGYNTTTGNFDAYTASGWVTILPSASGSTTQLPSSAMPTGSVIQVVQVDYNTITSSTAGSFVSTGLSASITPQFSTSKILILASVPCAVQATSTSVILGIRRGASTNLYAGGFGFAQLYSGSSTSNYTTQAINYLDSPSTTSLTTYTVTFSTTNGSVFPNNADGTITLLEIR
jgi:hypothetical protein